MQQMGPGTTTQRLRTKAAKDICAKTCASQRTGLAKHHHQQRMLHSTSGEKKIQTKIHIYTPVVYKNKVRSRHSWSEACGWWRDGDGCSEDTTIALKEHQQQLCSQTYYNSLMIRRTKMAMYHLKIKKLSFFLIDGT